MLVKELYEDCFLFEESRLSHYIHHLLLEKKISLDDDVSKIDFNLVDHRKVAEMIQNNVLGIHRVGIYSLKMDHKAFAFIYAGSPEEAVQFYIKSFQKAPLNCHEYPLEFELTRGNSIISFRDMKKEFESFPAVAGCFEREV
jgi:hypothetical protein